MTNEEAIEVIEQDIPCEYDTDLIEALDIAIAALKAEPCEDCDKWETDKTACQKCGEPCGDAVKREAVLNTLDTMDKVLDENRTVEAYKELLKECYKALPPVTPKPRSGKWEVYKQHQDEYLICDQCRRMYSRWMIAENFCPNCGAKMEGESE